MIFAHGNKLLVILVVFVLLSLSCVMSQILAEKKNELKKSVKEYEKIETELEENNKKIITGINI